jgi:hypothetical protein
MGAAANVDGPPVPPGKRVIGVISRKRMKASHYREVMSTPIPHYDQRETNPCTLLIFVGTFTLMLALVTKLALGL